MICFLDLPGDLSLIKRCLEDPCFCSEGVIHETDTCEVRPAVFETQVIAVESCFTQCEATLCGWTAEVEMVEVELLLPDFQAM